jgi:hypothetical protein
MPWWAIVGLVIIGFAIMVGLLLVFCFAAAFYWIVSQWGDKNVGAGG